MKGRMNGEHLGHDGNPLLRPSPGLDLDLTRHKAQLINRALGQLSAQFSATFKSRDPPPPRLSNSTIKHRKPETGPCGQGRLITSGFTTVPQMQSHAGKQSMRKASATVEDIMELLIYNRF